MLHINNLIQFFLILTIFSWNSSSFSLISSNNDQCQLANWYDYKSKIEDFNKLVDVVQSSSFVRDILKKLDPVKMDEKFIGSYKKSFLGYDYQLDVSIPKLRIKGISSVYIDRVNVSSKTSLLAGGVIKGELNADVSLEVNVNQLTKTGCKDNEEEYLGLCYLKCSILTGGSHPLRTATNTCAKNGCGPNEEQQAGLCYPKCRNKWKGVGPVCWGRCDQLYGSDFHDTGLTCHRWWLPYSRSKQPYGRGVGTLPYAPWTKGLGCNGFGISASGGCATPYYKLCFTEGLKIKNSPCNPKKLTLNARIGLLNPGVKIDTELLLMMCKGQLLKNQVACKDLSPNDFVFALIQGKFNKFLDKALKRVHKLTIKSINVSFDKISNAHLEIKIGDNPFASKFLTFLVNISKDLINKDNTIRSFITSKIDEVGENLANDLILSKLAPKFGSTCISRRRLVRSN